MNLFSSRIGQRIAAGLRAAQFASLMMLGVLCAEASPLYYLNGSFDGGNGTVTGTFTMPAPLPAPDHNGLPIPSFDIFITHGGSTIEINPSNISINLFQDTVGDEAFWGGDQFRLYSSLPGGYSGIDFFFPAGFTGVGTTTSSYSNSVEFNGSVYAGASATASAQTPEPATAALVGAALAGVLMIRRRLK